MENFDVKDFKTLPDDDNIRFKEIIKKRLYQNKDIIHAIHSHDLDEAAPDEYVGVHILPFMIVPEVQDVPRTYICYTSNYDELARNNEFIKYAEAQFIVFTDVRDAYDKEAGIARHDLIAALIRREFNFSNVMGLQMECISDTETTTDTHYALRKIIFQIKTPNNVLRDARVINKQVRR